MKEPNKPLISKDWKNRLMLMQILTKKQVSENIHLKVENVLKGSQNKEEISVILTQIIEQSETEQEMIQKLENML